MWHNEEIEGFVRWTASHNRSVDDPARQMSLCRLDLYSLYNFIGELLELPRQSGSRGSRCGPGSLWLLIAMGKRSPNLRSGSGEWD
jgi:hypothetical protein